MAVVKTLATYELVQRLFPRPVTERDELGMAIGKAIDSSLSRFSHEASLNRRPTMASANKYATSVLDEELGDAHLELTAGEREKTLKQISAVLSAFRRSELFGLGRPRSRLILINGAVGVYAQPDFWNGKDHFYEMKSYRAVPIPADVELQLRMFQLAFPGFVASLVCFNRHSEPVEVSSTQVAPPESVELQRLLRQAYTEGSQHGTEKVLEYVDSPIVSYTIAVPAVGR